MIIGHILTLKELTPVRMIKNNFYSQIEKAYLNDASIDDLENILGKGRAKKGMFLGDVDDGELEIGQVASLLQSIKPARVIIDEIMQEFHLAKKACIRF